MVLLRAAACALIGAACALAALAAQAQVATESAIKAAFLYRFAGYVEWPLPAGTGVPFAIGIVGAPEVAQELSTLLAGRAIAGRPAEVRAIREGEMPTDLQMLYIGRGVKDVRGAVRAAHQHHILTVTESGLDQGGVINFVTADNRVSFEVSLEAAERTGHRISSRMLAVARRVVPKGAT